MAAPYEVEIDGKTYRFPYLTPAERIDFTQRGFEQRRMHLLKNLDDSGVSAEVRQERLDELEMMRGTDSSLLAYLRTIEGSFAILEASLSRANGQEPPDLEAMDASGLQAIAWKVSGLPDIEELAAMIEGGGEEDEDDSDPTEETPPETGTTKPASSDTTSPEGTHLKIST